MTLIVCQDGHNPYANKPNVTEFDPQKPRTYQGKLYTEYSYAEKFTFTTRLLKIIASLSLSILTGFIALAFEKVRTLFSNGITGIEHATVLRPYLTIRVRPADMAFSETTLEAAREWNVAKIFPRLRFDLGRPPEHIRLTQKNYSVNLIKNFYVSPFKRIEEFVPNDKTTKNFMVENYMINSWSIQAQDHPALYLQAQNEIGYYSDRLRDRFLLLYENALTQAINA